jgi:hypothetical protein
MKASGRNKWTWILLVIVPILWLTIILYVCIPQWTIYTAYIVFQTCYSLPFLLKL